MVDVSEYEEMSNQEADDIEALEKYDRSHPHYYCYVTSCSIEDLRAYATHRKLEFTDEFTKEQLAELLRADDKRFLETKEPSCGCCPWDGDPETDKGHFGCENCPPH